MRHRFGWKAAVGLVVLSALFVFGVVVAVGSNPPPGTEVQHGMVFTKGCTGTRQFGEPYQCSYTIDNSSDASNQPHDTHTINSITDVVAASGGNVNSGELLSSLTLTLSGGAFCDVTPVNGTGSGNTVCTMPFGSRITTNTFSFYSPIVPKDMTSTADHRLRDQASLGWGDLCDGTDVTVDGNGDPVTVPGGGNCNPVVDNLNASGSSLIVDANIQITPDGVNEVSHTHTFTGHVNVSCAPASATCVNDYTNAPAGTVISFAKVAPIGPGTLSGGNLTATTCATVGTSGSCTVLDTSPTTGVDKVRATTSVSVNSKLLVRSTGDGLPVCLPAPPPPGNTTCKVGQPGDGPDATKRWVNAKITITPDAVNKVGEPHTFTATVSTDDGLDAPAGDGVTGFKPVGPGLSVTITKTNSNGAVAVPAADCVSNTDINGQTFCTFTSNSAGVVTGNASSSPTVDGVTMPRTTDGVGANSGPATKRFVNAKITISPDAVNKVGEPHTFTATVSTDDGLDAPAGDGVTGFKPVDAGTPVTITLTNDATAVATPPGPCIGVTDGSGQFTCTFTSNTAGVVTGHATSTATVSGETFNLATNGVGANSPDAVKRFVNAKITITPDAVNKVGEPHTFTATVSTDDGLPAADPAGDGVTGFKPVGAGTPVTITLTNDATAVATPPGPCVGATDGSGQFTCTFTSNTAGVVTGHATSTVTVSGETFNLASNGVGANSPDAVKRFVNAKITITPDAVNKVGEPHTFTATVSTDDGLPAADPAGDGVTGFKPVGAGTPVTITLTNDATAVATPPGPCVSNTDANGQTFCTFHSDTAGVVTGHATSTVTVAGETFNLASNGVGANSPDAVKRFVNAKITITPNDTNPTGLPNTHVFTATVFTDDGLPAADPAGDGVTGFKPVGAGTSVTITLANSNGALASPAGPFTGNTDANGQFATPAFTSNTAGQVTGTATSSPTVGGETFNLTTDGTGSNSGPAVKLWIRTDVHDASHNVITTIAAPATVHDNFQAGSPIGTALPAMVTFRFYENGDCSGNAVSTENVLSPIANGTFESTPQTLNPAVTTTYSYQASYPGNLVFPAGVATCEPFQVTVSGICPLPPPVFGLGPAGAYTVLGLEGANLVISEGGTKIKGDVGLAANGTGSLLKATIDGTLFLDPTAHPDIHGDLTTNGIVIKNMSPENNAAFAANLALAAMAPTQPPIAQITKSTTISGGPGTNVISLAGVNLVKGALTINGTSSSLFIINVTGGFNFSSSRMVLTGGVQANNIIWNFIGPGADINIFKPGTEASGDLLAPYRNMIQDHATLNGRYIGATGGLTLKMHSAATVTCP